jgi:hypothetical protein
VNSCHIFNDLKIKKKKKKSFHFLFFKFLSDELLHFLLLFDFVSLLTGTIMTISKDRVKPSPLPDSWKLSEIFATGIVLGGYLAVMTVIFFGAAFESSSFERKFFQVTSLVEIRDCH